MSTKIKIKVKLPVHLGSTRQLKLSNYLYSVQKIRDSSLNILKNLKTREFSGELIHSLTLSLRQISTST